MRAGMARESAAPNEKLGYDPAQASGFGRVARGCSLASSAH